MWVPIGRILVDRGWAKVEQVEACLCDLAMESVVEVLGVGDTLARARQQIKRGRIRHIHSVMQWHRRKLHRHSYRDQR